MSPRTASPTARRPRREPQLEGFHNIKQAAVRLGLQDPEDPDSAAGERWLRDGCNRPEDGSKGPQFPHHRMSGRLMFSDSQLAWIAELNLIPGTADRRRKSAA